MRHAFDSRSHFFKGVECGAEKAWCNPLGLDASTGDQACAKEGGGFHTVGSYSVIHSPQGGFPPDGNARVPCSLDLGTHGPEGLAQINDFRLACGVFNDRCPFSKRRRHQGIFGRSHAWEREFHDPSAETVFRSSVNVSVLDRKTRPESLECGEVEINRARSDRTTAGQAHLCLSLSRKQRTKGKYRSAHRPHQIIGRLDRLDQSAVCQNRMGVFVETGANPQCLEHFECRADVGKGGDISDG